MGRLAKQRDGQPKGLTKKICEVPRAWPGFEEKIRPGLEIVEGRSRRR